MSLAVLAMLPLNAAGAKHAVDFNHPQQVLKTALADLKRAQKTGDGEAVIDAVLRYSKAQELIGNDTSTQAIVMVENVIDKEKRVEVKAILKLHEVRLLKDYAFEVSSYRPDAPVADLKHIDEWSEKQIHNKADELLAYILEHQQALEKIPVTALPRTINCDSVSAMMIPTVFQFLMNECIDNQLAYAGKLEKQLKQQWLASTEGNIPAHLTAVAKAAGKTAQNLAFEQHKDSMWAGILADDINFEEVETLNMLNEYVERFPESPFAINARARITRMTLPTVRTKVRPVMSTRDTVITVRNTNAQHYTVDIYRIPDSLTHKSEYYQDLPLNQCRKVQSIDVRRDDPLPFYREDTITIAALDYGVYLATPVIHYNDTIEARTAVRSYSCFTASNMESFAVSTPGKKRAFVVNTETGAPIEGATVLVETFVSKPTLLAGITDHSGAVQLPAGVQLGNLRVHNGNDRFMCRESFMAPSVSDSLEKRLNARIYTDLGAYRPGETVKWTATASTSDGFETAVLAGKEFTVVFSDANSNNIDSITATTDGYGRIHGEFAVPTGILTGKYHITMRSNHQGKPWTSSADVTVSEYKLPTFDIELSRDKQHFNPGEPIVINGKASSFTDMPIAGSQVRVIVAKHPWSWDWKWFRPNIKYLDYEDLVMDSVITTSDDGTFSITLPQELHSPTGKGHLYSITTCLTSNAGETQEDCIPFVVGNRHYINLSYLNAEVFNADSIVTVPMNYGNYFSPSTRSDEKCDWSIYPKDQPASNIVASGQFTINNPRIDLSKVPSGEYTLKVKYTDTLCNDDEDDTLRYDDDDMDDDDDALYYDDDDEEEDETTIILYRDSDKQSPVKDSPLWVARKELTATPGSKAVVRVDTSTPESHVLCIVQSTRGIESEQWLDFAPGVHDVTIDVPSDVKQMEVLLASTYNNTSHREKILIKCVDNKQPALKINAVLMNKKIIPGSKERWSLAVTDTKGKPVKAALQLAMTDVAVDAIKNCSWNINGVYARLNFCNITNPFSDFYSRSSEVAVKKFTVTGNSIASLPTFAFDYDDDALRYDDDDDNDDDNDDDDDDDDNVVGITRVTELEVVEDNKVADYDVSKALEGMVHGVMVETECELSEVTYSSVDKRLFTGAAIAAIAPVRLGALDNISLRSDDVKTALWMPALVTDDNGCIDIEFDAPANSTIWHMQALAHDKAMNVDMMSELVLTQKPLMVKLHTPRFVRGGDQVTVSGEIMNATDSTMNALLSIAHKDHNDYTTACEIAPRGTVTQWAEFDVPARQGTMVFETKGVCPDSNVSDGERTIIPILPCTQTIVETQPFFIDKSDKATHLTFTVPQHDNDARTTLELCQNIYIPLAHALPTIYDSKAITSTGLAHSLFALNMAQEIMAKAPGLQELIEAERSDGLNSADIQESPWMSENDKINLRIARLKHLLNDEEMKQERHDLVDKLLDMQCSDGGWSWVKHEGATSNFHSTAEVLELLGDLKHNGALAQDAQLDSAMTRAMNYCDSMWMKKHRASKKTDYSAFSTFVHLHTLHSDIAMSKDVKALFVKTLKAMASNWRKLNLTLADKAYYAMALNRNGNHETARAIVASIKDFAVSSPELGTYWNPVDAGWRYYDKVAVTAVLLNAIHEVEGASPFTHDVSKWMLLMKQTNDWGSSSLAADAINCLISTGEDKNYQPAHNMTITVGDKKLLYREFAPYYHKSINAAPGTKITVTTDCTPCWGAIYTQHDALMSEIAHNAINELEVKKEYLVYGQAGKMQHADTLQVGDKVQVRLVIKNNRDLDFVTLTDERAACFEPVDQLSGYRYMDGMGYYLETRDASTKAFITRMDKGTHVITYDAYVTSPGTYSTGAAHAQCQYAPQVTAHTAGGILSVTKK